MSRFARPQGQKPSGETLATALAFAAGLLLLALFLTHAADATPDPMRIRPSTDVVQDELSPISVPAPFGTVLKDVERDFSASVSGLQGSGKSTWCLGLAHMLVPHAAAAPGEEAGNVLYCAAEEGDGATMKEKLQRLGAVSSGLHISDFTSHGELLQALDDLNVQFLFLDSATAAGRPDDPDTREMLRELKQKGVGTIYVLHQNKDGRASGRTWWLHDPDIVIEAERLGEGEHVARTTHPDGKNRYGALDEAPIPMTADQMPEPAGPETAFRENPDCSGWGELPEGHPKRQQCKAIFASLREAGKLKETDDSDDTETDTTSGSSSSSSSSSSSGSSGGSSGSSSSSSSSDSSSTSSGSSSSSSGGSSGGNSFEQAAGKVADILEGL